MCRKRTKVIEALVGVLDSVDELAQSIPPVDNEKSRFGNPAFRTFYDAVQRVSWEKFVVLTNSLHSH